MLYTEPKGMRGKKNSATMLPKPVPTHRYVQEFDAEDLKKSLLSAHEMRAPLEELIATSQAVFEFVRCSDMDRTMKDAFYQLEKQFDFYKNLIEL